MKNGMVLIPCVAYADPAAMNDPTDPASVIQSLTAHTLVKDPKLYQVMGVPSLDPNGTMDASTWDPFQDFYVSSGILERKLDLSQYMDTQLVHMALDRLGRE